MMKLVDIKDLESLDESRVGSSPTFRTKQCENGEIGRRRGLKIPRFRSCGFEPRFSHQKMRT